LSVASVVSVSVLAPVADATLLAQWNFDHPINPDTGSVFGWGSEAGPYYGVFQVNTGNSNTTFTTPAGNGSAYGFSADRWSQGSYAQIDVYGLPSYLNSFTVSWDQTRATFGPAEFRVDVSFDGGSVFTTLPNSAYNAIAAGAIGSGTNAWSTTGARQSEFTRSISFSGALTGTADVIKIRFVATGANLGNGAARFDNIVVSGVPAPGALALLGIAGVAATRRRRPSAADPMRRCGASASALVGAGHGPRRRQASEQ
jgi:MYXO-CTERM domain-containing protein